MQSSAAENPSAQEILDAVLRVVAKGGVDAVRYRTVAEEAGVSLGTVSYHYRSREDLLRAALTHYLHENTQALHALRDAMSAQSLDDAAQYMVALVQHDFADPRRRVVAEYEMMVFAARDAQVAEALERFERAMVAELAHALEALGVHSPFAAARTLAEMIRGFELSSLGLPARDLQDFGQRVRAVLSAFCQPPNLLDVKHAPDPD